MSQAAVLLAQARRQAREALGLAGSLALHAVAAVAVVLFARFHMPALPAPVTVELVIEAEMTAAGPAEAPAVTAAATPDMPPGPVRAEPTPAEPVPTAPVPAEAAVVLPPPDAPAPVVVEPAAPPRPKPPAPRPAAAPPSPPTAEALAAPAPIPAPASVPAPAPANVARASPAPAPARPAPPPNISHRYGVTLLQWLERYRDYPRSARLRRQEGSVLIRLTIDRSGRLLGAEIASSSGIDVLDNAALDTARRAAPMPPLPQDLAGDRVVMIVPVVFGLGGG